MPSLLPAAAPPEPSPQTPLQSHYVCLRCRYDLFGAVRGQCPECGQAFTAADLYQQSIIRPILRKRTVTGTIVRCIVCIVLAFVSPRRFMGPQAIALCPGEERRFWWATYLLMILPWFFPPCWQWFIHDIAGYLWYTWSHPPYILTPLIACSLVWLIGRLPLVLATAMEARSPNYRQLMAVQTIWVPAGLAVLATGSYVCCGSALSWPRLPLLVLPAMLIPWARSCATVFSDTASRRRRWVYAIGLISLAASITVLWLTWLPMAINGLLFYWTILRSA